MSRLPIFCALPALLAALPLAAQAQVAADSVVRTTVTTTVTTTTVVKPASAATKLVPAATTSSSTTSTTTAPAPTVRQPGPGDLTGARPPAARPAPAAPSRPAPVSASKSKAASQAVPRTSATTTTSRTSTAATPARRTSAAPADPELTHLLQTDVDLTRVPAEQLPNLYERFLETTRAERRQWTSAKWATASSALSRLNQRYEQVRTELSLEDKLNIRSLQGEFRALEAAKQVSKNL